MANFDRITFLRDKWKPYDNRTLTYRGVSVSLHFMEFAEGRIDVELIPQSDVPSSEIENWPVDVLSLSADEQEAIIEEIDYDPGFDPPSDSISFNGPSE